MSFAINLVETLRNNKIIVAVTSVAIFGLVLFVALAPSNSSSAPNLLASPGDVPDLTILGTDKNLQEEVNFLQAPSREKIPNRKKHPIVKVAGQGRVRGTTLTSRQGRSYSAFYQVPYARPPLGKLRFKTAQPPRPWFGIRDATRPGNQCIQQDKNSVAPIVTGKEDCLILNVYTPKLPQNSNENPNLPVIFYVRGGAQYGNGTRYGAKYFMDEDVVIVTIEFRAGILGHFTTGTPEYPGNTGTKDIVFALKWVNKNINKFGGDPNKVTLMGHSTGGFEVQALTVSGMTKGLYRGAIYQSGSALRKGSVSTDPSTVYNSVIAKVGCEKFLNSTAEVVDCLQNVDAKTLILAMDKSADLGFVKEPIPENGDTSNTLLTDYPWGLIQRGESHPVPILVGTTSLEGLGQISAEYLITEESTDNLNNHWEELFPTLVPMLPESNEANFSVARDFYENYIGNRPISNETRLELDQIASDMYTHPMRLSALYHATTTGQPAYLYWISKEPAKSYAENFKQIFPPPYGVAHADELQYLFLYEGYPEIPVDSPWFKFSSELVKIWVSFAATGKPICPTTEWKPIDPLDNGMTFFELGDKYGEIQPVTKRMLFFDTYIDELYVR